MNTKNLYTALTIGPIHKTLQSVKSTKAIWAASYMFSYLMKEIIKRIKNKDDIILPYSGKLEINKNPVDLLDEKYKPGTGFFPDRLIVKGKVELQNIINKILTDFAEKVLKDLTEKTELKKVDKSTLIKYLQNYFYFYHLSIELDEIENVLFRIYELLDSLELQQRVLSDDGNYLNAFLEDAYYNFLIENEFDRDEKRFPSTIEIAKSEYKDVDEKKFRYLVNTLLKDKKGKDKDSVDTQLQFIEKFKNEESFKNTVRNYQKYIVVVQADGDNIGDFIKYLYTKSESEKNILIKRFSKNLLSFAIEAVGLIKNYKGTPIYAGGDDLLFFAPVAHSRYDSDKKKVNIEKTILTLIHEIDEKFKDYFTNDKIFKGIIEKAIEDYKKNGEEFKKPTMSYGVSISYYKFPLNEALEEGVNQLFNKAKKTAKKNAVSFTVLKHSGQCFGSAFHKDDSAYNIFTELIPETITGDNFIHSIVYKLEPQKAVLFAIGCETDKKKRDVMFDNFFENNFNESIHTEKDKDGKKKLIPFLEKTKELIKSVFDENPIVGLDKEKKNDENILKIYSALRFIDFIHNKEEKDE